MTHRPTSTPSSLPRSALRGPPRRTGRAVLLAAVLLLGGLAAATVEVEAQGEPNRPVLHGRHWVAVTGKPLAAEAGARMFRQGGNAVDAATAMLAATMTMWDVISWGGETQALIYNPNTGEVIGINGLGIAPTGATPQFFREKGMEYPPAFGPLAAVTPGNPGALMTMLAEYGTMSLAEVLEPAIEMAEGYPIEASTADRIERSKERIKEWEHSRELFLPHLGEEEREAPYPGEIFRQPDLERTLRKLVEREREALADGASREEAIYAAYDRFYEGDIADAFVEGVREAGGLITKEDLASWEVKLEEPVSTTYASPSGEYSVHKLTSWTQGPVLLQMLNMLEPYDLASMGFNSARYIHTLYQAMNRAFADRDFYYGDPYVGPEEPMEGLLSKEYARARMEDFDPERNDPDVAPGDPYAFQEGENPFLRYLERWPLREEPSETEEETALARRERLERIRERFERGTTSIQAADSSGWVVSATPSGGWVPAVIAGETGIGMSQRMQSFVLDSLENPYNVVEPGKRPRATLTPSLALKDGEPAISFSIQGGDFQDQNSLQFFLDMVEFEMAVNEAAEAPNFNTYQLHDSFGEHEIRPGHIRLNSSTPPWVRERLGKMGYEIDGIHDRTSGPMTAIWFDREHGTFWGAASDYGDDYGIAW